MCQSSSLFYQQKAIWIDDLADHSRLNNSFAISLHASAGAIWFAYTIRWFILSWCREILSHCLPVLEQHKPRCPVSTLITFQCGKSPNESLGQQSLKNNCQDNINRWQVFSDTLQICHTCHFYMPFDFFSHCSGRKIHLVFLWSGICLRAFAGSCAVPYNAALVFDKALTRQCFCLSPRHWRR